MAKLLIKDIPPIFLAALLYLGAFVGLSLFSIKRGDADKKAASLEKKDLPWLAGAILAGGVAGPICMMTGLSFVSGLSASLLLNLEGVMTALIAVFLFKENAGKRLWLALTCMTIAGIFLSWDAGQSRFNIKGPLLILIAMVCWGIDNNLTRSISDKDPVQIAKIKGLVAGTVSFLLALFLGVKFSLNITIVFALLLGAFSYGVSLVFFIKALKRLGSSRTGAFFSFAPFVGALVSLIVLREWIGWVIFPAAAFMIIGVWLIISEEHLHVHLHQEETHNHSHTHNDLHHFHDHIETDSEPHVHEHKHPETSHIHVHWPDTNHRHNH